MIIGVEEGDIDRIEEKVLEVSWPLFYGNHMNEPNPANTGLP